jgi:cell division protein FtsB
MLEFQEKRKIRRFLYSKAMLAALVVLLLASVQAAWGVYKKNAESSENLAIAKKQLERLEARQAFLEDGIRHLSTERGIEEEIRDKFRVAKPGEHMIVIVENEPKQPTAQETKGFWQKIKEFF